MNVSLVLIMVLLIMIQKICFTLDVWLAHATVCLSIQAFACLNQVVEVSCLSIFSSGMQNHRSIILKLLNFVIDTIFAMPKIV